MKKIIIGLVAGLVLGGGTAWLLLHHTGGAAPESPGNAALVERKAGPGVHLSKEQVAQVGLTVAPPEPVHLAPEVMAYGRVLDSAPLLTLAAELAAARATLSASEKEHARVETLHEQGENASAQAVEAAEAAVQRDRSAVDSVRARLVAGWGATLASEGDLLRALGEGRAALGRVDLMAGDRLTEVPVRARVGALADDANFVDAEVLGLAPTTDLQTQGVGYLLHLAGASAPPPGSALRAFLPAGGGEQAVLVVPRTALVQHQGSVFVYVQTGEGDFERRLVEPGRALPNGVALTGGLAATDRVVTVGAQQLLSTELQAAGVTGD